jgi:hypothetical protein
MARRRALLRADLAWVFLHAPGRRHRPHRGQPVLLYFGHPRLSFARGLGPGRPSAGALVLEAALPAALSRPRRLRRRPGADRWAALLAAGRIGPREPAHLSAFRALRPALLDRLLLAKRPGAGPSLERLGRDAVLCSRPAGLFPRPVSVARPARYLAGRAVASHGGGRRESRARLHGEIRSLRISVCGLADDAGIHLRIAEEMGGAVPPRRHHRGDRAGRRPDVPRHGARGARDEESAGRRAGSHRLRPLPFFVCRRKIAAGTSRTLFQVVRRTNLLDLSLAGAAHALRLSSPRVPTARGAGRDSDRAGWYRFLERPFLSGGRRRATEKENLLGSGSRRPPGDGR